MPAQFKQPATGWPAVAPIWPATTGGEAVKPCVVRAEYPSEHAQIQNAREHSAA
jgi:hypothetical protein